MGGGGQGGTERELKISGAALELMVVVSLQCTAGVEPPTFPGFKPRHRPLCITGLIKIKSLYFNFFDTLWADVDDVNNYPNQT